MTDISEFPGFIPVPRGNGRKAPTWITHPLDCRPLPDGGWCIAGPVGWNEPGQRVRCIDGDWGETDEAVADAPVVGDVLTITKATDVVAGRRYLAFEGRDDWFSDDGFEPL